MITVAPAKTTARPAVSMLVRTASCTSPCVEVVLAEPGDYEQRVVDADSEPDHRRELRGEVRHIDDVRSETREADAGSQTEQRRDDRQAHCHERPEGDEQHDDRREQPDRRCGADGRLLHLFDRLPSERHLQLRRGGAFRD